MTVDPARPRTDAGITRVGLVAKTHLRDAATVVVQIASWLTDRRVEPVFEVETARLAGTPASARTSTRDNMPHQVDLVLVLGGDGTLIGMADRIAEARVDVPILGVNFGSLGFLTEITLPELYPALESALEGTAAFDRRMMLRSRTVRGGRVFAEKVVLNDVVITKGALARIINLSVSVGDEFVTNIRADGLILSSPTGSTAYNLAAAGPIVHPDIDALLLTPIAPHSLANRPIVLPASSEIQVRPLVDGANEEVYVTFDGQSGFQLQGDDVVTVARAESPLRLVRASRAYYEVLRRKLRWGERVRSV